MDKGKCYSKENFEDYYNGKLSREEDKAIDRHLDKCPNCIDKSLSIKLKPIKDTLNELAD